MRFKISLAPFFTISFYSYLVQTFLCHHMYLFNHIISTLVLSCPEVLRLLPGGRKKNDNQSRYDRLFLILRSLICIMYKVSSQKKMNTRISSVKLHFKEYLGTDFFSTTFRAFSGYFWSLLELSRTGSGI